jgi:hypothetical protein
LKGVGVVMPVFRYFLVMGCCLIGLLFTANWMWPGDAGSGAHPATVAAADLAPADSAPADLAPAKLISTDSAPTGSASTNVVAAPAVLSSIEDWRRSEGRFERSKQDPEPIIYPNIATLAPTADRLQWERQLRYLPENHVYEARAEMPKGTAVEPPKVAVKTAPPRKHVAHARSNARTNARTAAHVEGSSRPLYARNTGWGSFGLFD